MVEFFRHAFGFCGEHWHPNIWTMMLVSPLGFMLGYYVKSIYSHIKLTLKNSQIFKQ